MQNETSAEARTAWVEDMPAFGPDAQVYEGQESRDALAQMLGDAPAADEHEVTRRLRAAGA